MNNYLVYPASMDKDIIAEKVAKSMKELGTVLGQPIVWRDVFIWNGLSEVDKEVAQMKAGCHFGVFAFKFYKPKPKYAMAWKSAHDKLISSFRRWSSANKKPHNSVEISERLIELKSAQSEYNDLVKKGVLLNYAVVKIDRDM